MRFKVGDRVRWLRSVKHRPTSRDGLVVATPLTHYTWYPVTVKWDGDDFNVQCNEDMLEHADNGLDRVLKDL